MSGRSAEAPTEGAALRWTVHPARESPAHAAVVAGIVLVAAALAGHAAASPAVAVLAALFLGLNLRAFFLPRTYELSWSGARESGPLCAPRALGWEHVKAVSPALHGVHLSPRRVDSRWLPDRGLFLRTGDNRAQVLAWLARVAPR